VIEIALAGHGSAIKPPDLGRPVIFRIQTNEDVAIHNP